MGRETRLDGALVHAWADACVHRLREVAPRIDALNVFPVADADTGQNVTCTFAGGLAAVAASPGDLATAARVLASGALRQARGSSGVIMSGWLAGLAAGLAQTAPSDVARLGAALGSAAVGARRAVADPWEGTILEVAEQVAAAVAQRAQDPQVVLADLLPGPLDEVRTALPATSAHHPVLASAGVVDAGACALLVVLEVLAALLAGEPCDQAGQWLPPPAAVRTDHHDESSAAFEVMLHVTVEVDCTELATTGSAAAVTGMGDEWRTHVHTDDPATALGLVAPDELRLGVVRAMTTDGTGLVVVTSDAGLAGWYADAGAVVVVPGGAAVPGQLRTLLRAAGRHVLATDPGLAEAVGARTADPVRAAVACLAADTAEDVAAVLDRVRTTMTDDPDPTAALAALCGATPDAEVLTVVPRDGAELDLVRDLADGYAMELVLVGPATTGALWRLGVD
ncbi:MAG: DAK2 domain-containing protein [Micrococcales bacterium]|nr:DAK2 domain-containing protein [Micrococcales bacterium]MCL2666871.1 DAK2 domain-containing protein [Micrococcales bacterium]